MVEDEARRLSASEKWYFFGHVAMALGALALAIARVLDAAKDGRLATVEPLPTSEPPGSQKTNPASTNYFES